MESAPTASPKIFDLPPEIVTMIGKAIKDDLLDPREGLRSLSKLNVTCRYMRECTLTSLWEVVITEDDDFVVSEARRGLLRALSCIPSYDFIPIEHRYAIQLTDPTPRINTITSYCTTPDDTHTAALHTTHEHLEIELRLQDPHRIDELTEAIISTCQSWTYATGRAAEIKVLDVMEIVPEFGVGDVRALWKGLEGCIAGKFCVVIRLGFASEQEIEESHKRLLSAAVALDKPIYIIYNGLSEHLIEALLFMIENTPTPSNPLQIYIKYPNCQCSLLNEMQDHLESLWNGMKTHSVSKLRIGVDGGGGCVDREGFELDVQVRPVGGTAARGPGGIEWEPAMLWD